MFNFNQPQPVTKESKSTLELIKRRHDMEREEDRRRHEMEIREIAARHAIELEKKDFEIEHFKDEEIKKLEGKLQEASITIAVLQKENKMLDKIVDLNGDIVDVKNLVTKLIDKLPQIDLKSLTVNNNGNS